MTIDQVIRKIQEVGIVPVVRAAHATHAAQAVDAVQAGGIPVVEITMTVPDAIPLIRQLVKQYGDRVLIGAGTVLNAEQAHACLDAGAEFLVSPGLSIGVLEAAKQRAQLAIPGALTPTEIMSASSHGARLIKVFPCGNLGGAKYLKALRGPFPGLCLIPTGGVNASNAAEFIAAGAFALGVGSELLDGVALREGRIDKITAAAIELVAAVQSARSAAKS
ncbi:MAG TPA: bifunctional 4-hydroxy-2-oxoglutarate aldolase/2-dehydro-3-deoxy-phosphogluconate aldolase [Terriglobales bacterium]|jgi:2-dehydro-3-deoxyphosphogluconate aldolase/(4S)-4-hydroxy-2-oxoglutarate aldolase|nr:bifunctional 4-hydroxy-2-oxoglutarate aldolase/2-dehydro-3-deoxy-phosphogluconate aldolase [Terriglobales bacterium]